MSDWNQGGGYQQGGGGGGGGGWNQGGGGGGGGGGSQQYGGAWGGRQGGGGSFGGGGGFNNTRPGDWQCPAGCGNVFASKMNCFRCGMPKPEGAGDAVRLFARARSRPLPAVDRIENPSDRVVRPENPRARGVFTLRTPRSDGSPTPPLFSLSLPPSHRQGGGGYNQGGGDYGNGGGGGWGGGGSRGGYGYNDRPRGGPTPRPGDWNCPAGCGLVFASKYNCFRCGAPKPEGAGAEYGERQDQGGYDRGGPPPGEAPPRDISVDEYRSSGRSAQELADSLTREQR